MLTVKASFLGYIVALGKPEDGFSYLDHGGCKISVHGNLKLPSPPGYTLIMTAPLGPRVRISFQKVDKMFFQILA